MSERKRILIFNVNWLGDVLFSTATIRAIRYNYPESYIACVIPGRCSQVLEDNPHLDEVIIFDERTSHRSLIAKLRFVRQLRARRFECVFLLHRSFTRTFLCWLAGIRERIGFYSKKRNLLLTTKIKMPAPRALMHRVDVYLSLVEKAGLEVRDRHTEFYCSPGDRASVDAFLKEEGITPDDLLIGLNPGGNWDLKRWPVTSFMELAKDLSRYPRVRIAITGGEKDRALAEQIAAQMDRAPLIVCGKFTLKQFAALCRRLDVFISADSGPLHIAHAAGAKRIIALFGPTHPVMTGPYPRGTAVLIQKDVGCVVPCYERECSHRRCMAAITPADVLEKMKELGILGSS